jgi:hypothetical protein
MDTLRTSGRFLAPTAFLLVLLGVSLPWTRHGGNAPHVLMWALGIGLLQGGLSYWSFAAVPRRGLGAFVLGLIAVAAVWGLNSLGRVH